MHRNNKTRKSIAVLLVALITVAMLGVSPTLAEAGSCKGAVGALAASGAACRRVAGGPYHGRHAGRLAHPGGSWLLQRCGRLRGGSRHRPLLSHLGHGVRRGRHCRSTDLWRRGAA